MALELITGRAGSPHIDSEDIGAFNAFALGAGAYILNGCDVAMTSANTLHVSAGEILWEGRHIRIKGAGEDVQIVNGMSGYKRIDIVALRYAITEGNIESVSLQVINGTPSQGTPIPPEAGEGSILSGDNIAVIPFIEVIIDGLSPQPVMLFDQFNNLDSLAQKLRTEVRPISSGGTGGSTLKQANENLQIGGKLLWSGSKSGTGVMDIADVHKYQFIGIRTSDGFYSWSHNRTNILNIRGALKTSDNLADTSLSGLAWRAEVRTNQLNITNSMLHSSGSGSNRSIEITEVWGFGRSVE